MAPRLLPALLLLAPALAGCIGGLSGGELAGDAPRTVAVASAAFAPGGRIPREHTCQGANVAPSLALSGAPPGARHWAMLMEDPDGSRGTVTHWTFWDLPVARTSLARDQDMAALGAREGGNGTAVTGYRGPCPPAGTGTHRYVFQVFALAGPLGLPAGTRAAEFRAALDGKALAWGSLTGLYERQP